MGRRDTEIRTGVDVPRAQVPADATDAVARLRAADGLAVGALAGVVMSVWKMGADALRGGGLWGAPELIATIPLGERAYTGGRRFRPGPVLVGLALHEATSAAMGLAYVPLVRRRAFGRHPLATAVAYALAGWAVYQYAMMPWLAPVMDAHTPAPGLALAHVVFGLALGAGTARLGRWSSPG